jgi:hypothetical protein
MNSISQISLFPAIAKEAIPEIKAGGGSGRNTPKYRRGAISWQWTFGSERALLVGLCLIEKFEKDGRLI